MNLYGDSFLHGVGQLSNSDIFFIQSNLETFHCHNVKVFFNVLTNNYVKYDERKN